jgi:acetyl-CoA carboxylase biotin carboxyl carrier protein
MKTTHRGGRLFEPVIEALARSTDAGIELRAPTVGLWRPAVPGSVLEPGTRIGAIEVLGVLHGVVVPQGAAGVVVEADHRLGETPVGHGDVLLVLDPEGAVGPRAGVGAAGSATAAAAAGDLVFESPLSGRFYAKPAPDKAPFVSAGDIVSTGQTVGLLEVMKTFNRITYGGPGLPERARIVEIAAGDEADLDAGDPILRLEPA